MEQHIMIEDIQPMISCGRYPIKRVVNEPWQVQATIFRDGHDIIRAVLQLRCHEEDSTIEVPMNLVDIGLDHWQGELRAEEMGRYTYRIVAWTDYYATWVREMDRKIIAGRPDLSSEIAEGRAILENTLENTSSSHHQDIIKQTLNSLTSNTEYSTILELISASDVMDAMLYQSCESTSPIIVG